MHQRGECPHLALLWTELRVLIATVRRDGQQRREKRHVIGRGLRGRQHCFELAQTLLAALATHEAGVAFHSCCDRVKRAVLVIRRAEIAKADPRFVGQALLERGKQA